MIHQYSLDVLGLTYMCVLMKAMMALNALLYHSPPYF